MSSGHDDPTLMTANPEVARAVSRFWEARAGGRQVSVDEVLESAPGSPGYEDRRATAIRLISDQATLMSEGGVPPAIDSEAVTIGPSPLSAAAKTVAGGGPLPKIDGYDLVACLGRGGMGAVFEGYQQSTGRRVAVKFMLDTIGQNDMARKRFEREVEVVARLQHPGIVSIVDSGVRRGRYFYVMEYVAGRGLDQAFKKGECDVRSSLDLMARVCDAVDYAHQRGVLHRDLKPSNILVDEQEPPRPHLLDFGLAKEFDPADRGGGSHGALGLTVSGPGQLLGTVAYMSPEQAIGRHDLTSVRTDVYALGVIAYELLTGRLPCRIDGSLKEVLARITDEDPPAPSTIRKRLPHDLDAVLLKALEKDPDRRYPTVGEFAADVRRYLAGEPVLARRVGAAGRTWRLIRRNRTISLVVAAAVLALAAVSATLVARIVRERDAAQSTLALLRSIFESADPETAPGVTLIQLLDGATRRLDENPPERPLAEAEIREIIGTVQSKFGHYDQARVNQARALMIRERFASGDDAAVADALHQLAATFWKDGRYPEAEALYVRSLEMRRRLYRGDHPAIAMSLTHLAACRLRQGRVDEARTLYDEALVIRRRLYGDRDHEEVAQSLNNVAKCSLEVGDFARAEHLFGEALAMIRRLKGDSYHGTAAASQNLADCFLRRATSLARDGQSVPAAEPAAQARDAFERALRIRSTMYPTGHHLVAASMLGLARASAILGELDHAAELAAGGVAMLRSTRRPDHADIADGLEALASVDLARGDHAGAIAACEEALRICAQLKPAAPRQQARLEALLGQAQALAGDPAAAESSLLRSINGFDRARGDQPRADGAATDPEHAAVVRRLTDLYSRRGDTAAADALRARLRGNTN